MLPLVLQKWLAYPPKILSILFAQVYSRPDASVNEEIVTELHGVGKVPNKGDVFGRYDLSSTAKQPRASQGLKRTRF
jgi:hypothetical protein